VNPDQIPGEVGVLIEERARQYEREVSDSGITEIAGYLDGLEGPARSTLIARLVEVEDSQFTGAANQSTDGESTLPRHDRFRLIRELGAGGMGVVYEAWDRERQMSVALKTVQYASPQLLMLFKKEFRSLAKIVHPNLVSLYELFSDGEQWFFSMEFVENANDLKVALRGDPEDEATLTSELTNEVTEDLSQVLVDQSVGSHRQVEIADLDFDRVRSIFSQVAEGVVALHHEDKLHRDLKPGNVLVRADDRVLLLDFGLVGDIVRHTEGSSSEDGKGEGFVASSGSAIGTISYMAPEQAAAKELGTGSDWYAVGVMLFEALTGRLPFEGNKAEKIRQKLTTAPPHPSAFNPAVPADLDRLCFDMLQRLPEDRPSGQEVLRRLSKGTLRGTAGALEQRYFVGRERELASLRLALAHASEGETSIVHLHGRSGVGKSALVQKFLSEVEHQKSAVVLSGRCYEQETVPYKAFDSVVDTLASELNGMPPKLVEDMLPVGIAALSRIFPVLGSVPAIAARGQVPLSQDLEGLRQRAFATLRHLLTNLARHRTLVIHIDDLQWGDLDSADLLAELLLPSDRPPLLLLLTYRSEYLARSPSLAAINALGEGGGNGLNRSVIAVGSLSTAETRRLAGSILVPVGTPEQVEWVIQESEGIAFFVYELAMYALETEPQQIESGADLEQVLWNRIGRYPADARQLLEVVAVAAQPLSLRSAQVAAGVGMLSPDILASLRAGYLLRGSGTGLHDQVESYHDRVREIVSGRLQSDKLRSIHASLAETFEEHQEGGPERLARHYLESGQHAQAGRNFEKAADQAVNALAFDRAEEFFERSIELAADVEERALRQEKIIHFYTNAARFEDAYRVGREALAPLGFSLPAGFRPPPFLVDLVRARINLGRRKIPEIIDLPTADDTKHRLAIRLFSAVGKAAYQLRPELCIAVLVKSVNACLAKGNTPDAAVGFMAFGAIFLGGILGRHKDGYDFGRLSLDLVDKYDDDVHRAEVNFVIGYFGTSWLRPAQEAEELFARAFDAGQESGDLFHTGCACAAGVLHRFMRGVPMADLLEETEGHIAFLERLRLRETLGAVKSTRQAIRNLRGETKSRTSLSDSAFDEESFAKELTGFGSRHFAHYHAINRMIVMTHWNEVDAGLEAAEASLVDVKDSKGMLHWAEHFFYRSMILSAARREGRHIGRRGRREIRGAKRRFESWARNCPENFQARALLLRAELALIDGQPNEALSLYANAADAADSYKQPQIAALAHRNAAGLLEMQGESEKADDERRQAAECYRRWGSEPLADQWSQPTSE
jgi:serine/threonine protein kinase/tetratricopeptide (TPR) repeat protein